MPSLYWTKYDELQFAARHILENFDTTQIKNHNNFWPAGTNQKYLAVLLEWIIDNYSLKFTLPEKRNCGPGFTAYEILLDYGVSVRVGINSQGRILLLQPLDGPNVIKVNSQEAEKLLTVLFSAKEK